MSYILIIKYTENFKLLVLRRVWINSGSIIYSVDGNKNAFKVLRLRGLMLPSVLLFFIWKICQ